MAKIGAKKPKHSQTQLVFDEIISGGDATAQALVVLVIPSHRGTGGIVQEQSIVITQGMKLLAELFGGATSFQAKGGIWYDSEAKEYLVDRPMLLESYASVDELAKVENLDRLIGFMKQVGRDMKQKCVAFVLGDRMHFMDNYRGAPKKKLF